MKLIQQTEETSRDRKLIKSQVEKRRRERMNCSLERLRSILMQELPQPGGTQHRVEKAEILKHTVLFLQKVTRGSRTGSVGQNLSFQDGFSSCLQRAAHFLQGPQEKGPWLGASLDAHFASRFARSDSDPAADLHHQSAEACPSRSSLTQTKSILRLLRQKSKPGPRTRTSGANTPHQHPAQQGLLPIPQEPLGQSRLEVGAQDQTLWRPWP